MHIIINFCITKKKLKEKSIKCRLVDNIFKDWMISISKTKYVYNYFSLMLSELYN